MSVLLKQINESAIEQDRLASYVLQNTQFIFEGFTDSSMSLMCESAANYISQVISQLQRKSLKNPEQVVDMLAGLRVLGSAQNRDAFNIKLPTFKVLTMTAGDSENVDSTLSKLGRNPSVKTIRGQIEQLINGAVKGDEAAIKTAISNLDNLRTGYQRVQTKLQNNSEQKPEAKPTSSTIPAAKPVPNQAGTSTVRRKETAPSA